MRIGFSGRIGVGIMLFAAVADGASWLVRAIDDYPFDFYRQIDAYLPVVFLFGLTLLLPSISIAFQTKRAANLGKFPLTVVGPLPPELRWEVGQVEWGDGANRRSPAYDDEIPAPKLAFVPSPSRRALMQRVGRVFFLLAVLTVSLCMTSTDWDLPFYLLVGVAFLLKFWPDVRETDELSLQGEPRATFRGMASVDRNHRRPIPVMKPLSSLRVFSYVGLMFFFILWIIYSILTPLTPRGLMVYVPKPGTYARADEPWNKPLVVRIDALGNLYLNREPVRLADLGELLEKTLSLRADWTVFVDEDPDAVVGDVIAVVDVIHGIGGTKAFLVTPSMKKEKPELAIIPPCEKKAPHPPELMLPPKWRGIGYYEYPFVTFVVDESGEVSNVKIQRKGDYPEFAEWLARSARKLKYPPAPGCGKHEFYLGYHW
jgi:biopolymer transport protein ExbD